MNELSYEDQHISRSELDDAAAAIEATENEDLEDIFRSQGADDVVNTLSKEDADRNMDSEPESQDYQPNFTAKSDFYDDDYGDEATEDMEQPKP